MTVFLITTATVLFIMLILNFGYYYFKKMYPFLLGEIILWDKKLDRLKLLLGITTLFFAYFSFQSIWAAGTVFKELNIILYAILLVSNILFYVIYTQNKILFNTPSLTENSEEKKKIEEQIREQMSKEKKKKEIEERLIETIYYIVNTRGKIDNNNTKDTDLEIADNSPFSQLKVETLKKIHEAFTNENIIDQTMPFADFKIKLIEKSLQLNLNGPSLYYFHKKFKQYFEKEIPSKISLINFITHFKRKNDKSYRYGTVRNGVSQPFPLHKELFEEMFVL